MGHATSNQLAKIGELGDAPGRRAGDQLGARPRLSSRAGSPTAHHAQRGPRPAAISSSHSPPHVPGRSVLSPINVPGAKTALAIAIQHI